MKLTKNWLTIYPGKLLRLNQPVGKQKRKGNCQLISRAGSKVIINRLINRKGKGSRQFINRHVSKVITNRLVTSLTNRFVNFMTQVIAFYLYELFVTLSQQPGCKALSYNTCCIYHKPSVSTYLFVSFKNLL